MSKLKLPKHLDFDRITRAITGKEALGLVFRNSTIKDDADDGESYNAVSFVFHPDGVDPPPCIVQAASDPAPASHDSAWEGSMLVQGRVRKVVLWRRRT
jgi:hypothetical protein